MDTKEIIAQMLTENTGRHMLDSGGAYGRHWEQNQSAVAEKEMTAVEYFEAQPVAKWEYGPTLNVYHFLVAAVDYVEEFDKYWYDWVYDGPEDRYINGTDTMLEFIDELVEKGWVNENYEWHKTIINTYNNEDALSQVLQYMFFQITEDSPWFDDVPSWTEGRCVLLSIHGGCDVRGGYTGYRIFAHDPTDGDGPSLFDNARVTLYCDNKECKEDKWGQRFFADSDDAGYSWHSDYVLPNGDYFDGKFGERDWPEGTKEYEKDAAIPLCPICYDELNIAGWCY